MGLVPVSFGLSTGVGLFSYADHISLTVLANQATPQLPLLVRAFTDEFELLCAQTSAGGTA